MNFEWDENKNKLNQQKHGISFEEVKTIFNDPLALSFDNSEIPLMNTELITFGVLKFSRVG